MSARTLVVATTNPGKLRELRELLTPCGFQVRGLDELGVDVPEPVEDGATFEENARIKARAYAEALGVACLAEDSGLEVSALGGAPGVHSARYSGEGGPREARDRANNEKLLRALADAKTADRSARFVCAMCLIDADGTVRFETRGTFEGVIAEAPRGDNGFGYDPLLYLPALGKTSAELPSDEKNRLSHRSAATRALVAFLTRT